MNKYTGTFRKSNGTTRTMNFITESDAKAHFGRTDVTTSGTKTNIGYANKLGRVLVFDVDINNWRYFNTSTQVGDITLETAFHMPSTGGSSRH